MNLSRMLSTLVPVRVTVAYAATLFVVASVLLALGPRVQDVVIGQLSTNLHNLAHGHLGTLFASAFVTAEGQTYLLLPGLICLMALAELLWRSGRLPLEHLVSSRTSLDRIDEAMDRLATGAELRQLITF
jgi:hypothetical protein